MKSPATSLLSIVLLGASAFAQPAPDTRPALPLLRELDRETRGLYQSLQSGVLRLQLPDPLPARNGAAQNDWLTSKYPKLNADMRQRLLEQQAQITFGNNGTLGSNSNNSVILNNSSNLTRNSPSTTQPLECDVKNGVTIIVPSPNAWTLNNSAPPGPQPQALVQRGNYTLPPGQSQTNGNAQTVSPNNLGVLIDGRGHLLVPQYLDHDMIGDQPIRVYGPDGGVTDARLVGADQQTGLAVLQLNHPPMGKTSAATTTQPVAGYGDCRPVVLGDARPTEGSLVLLLSPADGTGTLQVWNDAGKETGVVVDLDGRVAGITRSGQFLTGSACQLIAEQIIRNGAVRRATLGVIITQIDPDDPARAGQPLLADRGAVRIDQVMVNSAAERGGIRQGDVLLSIDGQAVADIPTLAAAIAAKRGTTRLHLLRGDKLLDVALELEQK